MRHLGSKILCTALALFMGNRLFNQNNYQRSLFTREESFEGSAEGALPQTSGGHDIDTKKKEICFINSSFGKTKDNIDKMLDETNMQDEEGRIGFFFFTNLEDLEAPGWEKIVMKLHYKRYATQSKWPKFFAWKHPIIAKSCKLIYYFDVRASPNFPPKQFLAVAEKYRSSEFGMAQAKHVFEKITHQHQAILKSRKDTEEHIHASHKWLQKQSDFNDDVQSWRTDQIVYDPESVHFRKASSFFWNRFSLEHDTWMDQTLWWYTLHHFKITPMVLDPALFYKAPKRKENGFYA